jgi:catalase
MTTPNVQHTTDNAGIPAESDEHSLTTCPDGPILLRDHCLVEKTASFDREPVPERVVPAKGGGAYGRFEVTDDVSRFTRADLFRPGGPRRCRHRRASSRRGERPGAATGP